MLGLQEISRSDFSLSQDVKDTENIHYGSRLRKTRWHGVRVKSAVIP